jgi:hypothetical protein
MRETKAAFENRGIIYYYLFDEARKAMGKEKAVEIFKKGIYRRGQDIGKVYKDLAGKGDFRGIAEIFINGVPCEGQLFSPEIVEISEDGCVISMSSCPLADAWKEIGLSGEELDLICDVASAVDFGTFESAGLKLEFKERIGEGKDKCTLVITRA